MDLRRGAEVLYFPDCSRNIPVIFAGLKNYGERIVIQKCTYLLERALCQACCGGVLSPGPAFSAPLEEIFLVLCSIYSP
jgi:hypothetical protein